MQLWLDETESPLGRILLVHNEDALCALDFEDCEARMRRLLQARYGDVQLQRRRKTPDVVLRLRDYFQGELDALRPVPTDPGGTTFQNRVWSALREIPDGQTLSYGALARNLGKPGAARAVGLANSLNPIALVLPCHRVVGADGSLTGYAGGLARKRWLLEHEGIRLTPSRSAEMVAPTLGF